MVDFPMFKLLYGMLTDDTIDMPEPPDPLPTNILMLRLTISVPADEVIVAFDGIYRDKLPLGSTINDHLLPLLLAEPPWKTPTPVFDPDRELRPLSIQHNAFSYIVIFLGNKNVEYCRESVPFRVKSEKAAFYSGAECVWNDSGKPVHSDKPSSSIACKVAYFVADGKSDQIRFGKPVGATKKVFTTNFNIYIDVNIDGTKLGRIPITVDPDVGHPGGAS